MDRSLDEIVSEQRQNNRAPRRGGGKQQDRGRRNDGPEYPRDGISKRTRDEPRSIDSEWVHDMYEDSAGRQPRRAAYRQPSPDYQRDAPSAKLRVENLHYDLTEEDLEDLFRRIGPVAKLALTYDRAGRSEGIAYVTYMDAVDAKTAIREFDGANAKGQPIRLISIPAGPARNRERHTQDLYSSRSLADRITRRPNDRARSESPLRYSDVRGPPPDNVDRYVPGRQRQHRSRSPIRNRRGDGRRPGAKRERADRNGGVVDSDREGKGRDGRRKKTQEELDAEMDDYWGSRNAGAEATKTVEAAAAVPDTNDIEMVE